jgi:hypothetical protein
MSISNEEWENGEVENFSKTSQEGKPPLKDLLERTYPEALSLEEIRENCMINGNADLRMGDAKPLLMELVNKNVLEMKKISRESGGHITCYRMKKEGEN